MDKKNKKLIKTAKKLFRAGEYKRSAELFLQGGDLENTIEAYLKLRRFVEAGDIAVKLGRGEDAAQYYLRAGRYDILGNFYEARKNYLMAGRYFTRSGKHEKAAEMYDMVLQKWPRLNDAPGMIREFSDEEIKVTRLAAASHSRAGHYIKAAELYAYIEQYDEAGRNYRKAQEYQMAGESFEKAGLMGEAGVAYAEGGIYGEAGRCFEADKSYRLAAENYLKNKDFDKAGMLYMKAGDFFSASDAFYKGDNIDKAIKVLADIPPDSPTFLAAVGRVIRLSFEKGYLTLPAKRFCERYIGMKDDMPLDLKEVYEIALLYKLSEDHEKYIQLYRWLKKKAPDKLERFKTEIQVDTHVMNKDFKEILEEDFNASQRKALFEERVEKLQSVREEVPEEATIASDMDATLNTGMKSSTPMHFMHIREGQKFGDRYLVLQHLGAGGMGTVYKAQDIELDELIAIKILSPQFNLDENAVARFKQEIKLARQINHPNVIRIYDLGEFYGIKFITMEFFPGEQLKKIISEYGSYTPEKGIDLVLQICDGLIAAHGCGIIHRDIKSQNIMISTEGQVKLLDFGIAKLQSVPGLTTDGSILGTPEYISPEAILQKPVDARSDIYSLGIVMFEMFTGQVPFTGDNVIGVIRQHLYDDMPHPRSINERIPEDLEDIIFRCVEREPEERYQSVAELKAELVMVRCTLSDDAND